MEKKRCRCSMGPTAYMLYIYGPTAYTHIYVEHIYAYICYMYVYTYIYKYVCIYIYSRTFRMQRTPAVSTGKWTTHADAKSSLLQFPSACNMCPALLSLLPYWMKKKTEKKSSQKVFLPGCSSISIYKSIEYSALKSRRPVFVISDHHDQIMIWSPSYTPPTDLGPARALPARVAVYSDSFWRMMTYAEVSDFVINNLKMDIPRDPVHDLGSWTRDQTNLIT
jgi:hypothetical protein